MPLLILRAAPNDLGRTRLGIVCGRRVGNAVTRNRVKRRLREILRSLVLVEGWDVVVIARPGSAAATFGALKRAVTDLTRRGRLHRPAGTGG